MLIVKCQCCCELSIVGACAVAFANIQTQQSSADLYIDNALSTYVYAIFSCII